MASPVLTLTGNLLAERTFHYGTWAVGRTQRATREEFQVGGKGINVTRMLQRLGVATEALCFTGGAPGRESEEWLRARAIPARCFPTAGATRAGLVVRAEGVRETTFLGPDVPADAAACEACAAHLRAQPDGAVLAFSGSFPGFTGGDAAVLREALGEWARRCILIVDTYGPPLAWAVGQPASLIKINREEFDLLFPAGERETPVTERIYQLLDRHPAKAWVITDGPGAVHAAERGGEARTHRPPRVQEVSATGSGDVFLAALIHGRETQRLPLQQAVEYALPFGAANAAHPGVAEFDLNQVAELRSQIP
ncbi:1-phosphofructokinase family hexose kinase [Nibricoccus sp. IMCC34717]|uniref:1-phosphofructokinase family hexose kinase n=1 Tax=Nibricoccus sp. IMCC34717 TaxID=3034021 RepID=UPI0038513033